MKGLPEDWVHVATTLRLDACQYEDPVLRNITVKGCQYQLDNYLRRKNLSMIDSPSGKWVQEPLWQDEVRPTMVWAYRLHGWAMPSLVPS